MSQLLNLSGTADVDSDILTVFEPDAIGSGLSDTFTKRFADAAQGEPFLAGEIVVEKTGTDNGPRTQVRVPEGILGGLFDRHKMKTIVGVSVGGGIVFGMLIGWWLGRR